MSPQQSPSRDLQTSNNGDELRRHDLCLYFMRHADELARYQDEMDKAAGEEDERIVIEIWWHKIYST